MKDSENYRTEHSGTINLLRLCTVLLAGVSFWATAQGMVDYVFKEEWQAYAASMAIQGLLLGLNFYLPVFLKLADSWWKKGILIILTGIILFCSSWFSYVFIAGKVYQQSWEVESRLLVEQTYRKELFGGYEYGEAYQKDLEETLGQQVLELYERTKVYEGHTSIDIEAQIDWQEERDIYTAENFAARTEMGRIIAAVERALANVNNAEIQERSRRTVSDTKETIERGKTSLEDQSKKVDDEIEKILDQLAYADLDQNEGTDNTAQLQQQRNDLTEQRAELWAQQNDYQTAINRVDNYEDLLQMVSSNSANRVGEGLRSIQNELFKEEPDVTVALGQATDIFETLLRNEDFEDNEGTDYMTLLNGVNTFIQNLNRYQLVKGINSNFEDCIIELRDKQIEGEEWKGQWEKRLINLKSLISTLPNYDGEENRILMRFDRTESSNSLDNMIRNYILDHNAAQQGIIYLRSPYRGLAVFSLILAFFFDLAGFATGVLIQIQEEKEKKELEDPLTTEKEVYKNQEREKENEESENQKKENQQLWTILPMLNEYVYLTGDFTFIDGKYTYNAFKNGEKVEIDSTNKDILVAGLYIEDGEHYMPIVPQTLSFTAMEEGARDGIYKESSLAYEDSMLTIASGVEKTNREYQFLANIDENVPVYRVKGTEFEIFPAKKLKKTDDTYMVVTALNEKGTLVAAIYLI